MPGPAKEPRLDRLTGQLYHLPAIIGRLGLSIAEAQKEMNLDYVTNVGRLMEMIAEFLGKADSAEQAGALRAMLESLAPPRYQFTETTLDFSADLSETLQASAQGGVSLGAGAVMVNAAFALGYGYDYRAAARVTTVLHAIPAGGGPEMAKALLDRAKDLKTDLAKLPERTAVDKELYERVEGVWKAIAGK